MKNKIIFIHGFGVSKFSRGIFTDIEKYYSGGEHQFIYTDLNKVEYEDNKENITIKTPAEQALIIESVISDLKQQELIEQEKDKNINFKYTFICHSMGCVVVTFLNKILIPKNSKFIFLAPPTSNNLQKSIERYTVNPKNIIDLEKISILYRKDGSMTFIPKEFWKAREDLDYIKKYSEFAKFIEENSSGKIEIITAKQDEIIENSLETLEQLKNFAKVTEINGNHNFDNERENLTKTIIGII
jgi:surfactin synthase thioesterase subunit